MSEPSKKQIGKKHHIRFAPNSLGAALRDWNCSPSMNRLAWIICEGRRTLIELRSLSDAHPSLLKCRINPNADDTLHGLSFLREDCLIASCINGNSSPRLLFWRIETSPSKLVLIRLRSVISPTHGISREHPIQHSADGKWISFGCGRSDATFGVCVCSLQWENGSPKIEQHVEFEMQSRVYGFQLSPDGTRIAILSQDDREQGKVLSIYQVGQGKLEHRVEEPFYHAKDQGCGLVWFPDGRSIALWTGGAIEIWNAHRATRQNSILLKEWNQCCPPILASDGRSLLSVTPKTHPTERGESCRNLFQVWDLDKKRCVRRFTLRCIQGSEFRSYVNGRFLGYLSRNKNKCLRFTLLDFGRPNFGRGRDWDESFL